MPGRTLQTVGVILRKRSPSESFVPLTAFSVEEGVLTLFQRLTKKNSFTGLDLFDTASLLLESSNQGASWFVTEAQLISRPVGIGRSYETLRFASAFTAIVAKNPGSEEGRSRVSALVRQSLEAFAVSTRPDAVYLKSLYCFARDEGYPVKQQWFPLLSASLQNEAAKVLNTPLAELDVPAPKVALLQQRLEAYLRGHTEILME